MSPFTGFFLGADGETSADEERPRHHRQHQGRPLRTPGRVISTGAHLDATPESEQHLRDASPKALARLKTLREEKTMRGGAIPLRPQS